MQYSRKSTNSIYTINNISIDNLRNTTPTKYNYALNAISTERNIVQPIRNSVSPIKVVIPSPERISQSIHQVHHYERPLQVVSAQEMEQKYKFKLTQLEQTVYQLQVENQRLKMNGIIFEQSQTFEDTKRISELENTIRQLKNQEENLRMEIKHLTEELFNWKERYSQLQQKQNIINNDEEIRQLKIKISQFQEDNIYLEQKNTQKDQELLKLQGILIERDNTIEALTQKIEELQEISENYNRIETTVISLQGEVDVWRKKFKQKNEEASELSEKLIMAETTLEAMKKRQISKISEVNVSKSNRLGPTTMTQSIDMAGRTSVNRSASHFSGKQQL